MKNPAPDKHKVTIATRMQREERDAIRAIAIREDRTISQQVARLLRAGMKAEGVAIPGDHKPALSQPEVSA